MFILFFIHFSDCQECILCLILLLLFAVYRIRKLQESQEMLFKFFFFLNWLLAKLKCLPPRPQYSPLSLFASRATVFAQVDTYKLLTRYYMYYIYYVYSIQRVDTSSVSARRTLCMKLCWAGQLFFMFSFFVFCIFLIIPCNAGCWVTMQEGRHMLNSVTVGYLVAASFCGFVFQNFRLSNSLLLLLLLQPVLYFASLSQQLHAPLHSNTCDVDCIRIQS